MRRLISCGTAVLLVLAVREAAGQTARAAVDRAESRVLNADATQFQRDTTVRPLLQLPPRQPAAQPAASTVDQSGGNHWNHQRHSHHHGQGGSDWWFSLGFPSIPTGPVLPYYLPSYRVVGFNVVMPVGSPLVGYAAPLAGQVAALPAAQPVGNLPPPAPAPAADPQPPAPPKATNAQQKARAGRFLGFGDANFAKGNYNSAVERYKEAMEIAPDVAETYLRQAFAQVAMGNYDKAATAFRRALRVRADWRGTPFRLEKLYDGAGLAKTSHLERLAQAVEGNPFSADLVMVLGMQLFFDGQAERSRVFFMRAAQLGGNEDKLLDAFLPQPGPAGADPPAPPGKIVF